MPLLEIGGAEQVKEVARRIRMTINEKAKYRMVSDLVFSCLSVRVSVSYVLRRDFPDICGHTTP